MNPEARRAALSLESSQLTAPPLRDDMPVRLQQRKGKGWRRKGGRCRKQAASDGAACGEAEGMEQTGLGRKREGEMRG